MSRRIPPGFITGKCGQLQIIGADIGKWVIHNCTFRYNHNVSLTPRGERHVHMSRTRAAVTRAPLQQGTFQLSVTYGRRRVGKTAIIKQSTRSLPTVYFTAVEPDSRVNLCDLSRELNAFEHPGSNPDSAPQYRGGGSPRGCQIGGTLNKRQQMGGV